MGTEMGFVSISLPSRCLTYHNVKPEDVKVRPLKGKDEKLIAEMNSRNLEKKFLELLKNIVIGVDPSSMTIGDRLYILIWEAINSYSNVFNFEAICDTCYQKLDMSVDLNELEVISLPENYKEPMPIELSDGKIISLRQFTVQDEINILEYENSSGSSYLYRFAISIVEEGLNTVQKMALLEEMDSRDLARIRAFHEEYYHGPDMTTDYECRFCGGKGRAEVPFRIGLLFPFGKELKERYGGKIST